jgi:hypothetical protein
MAVIDREWLEARVTATKALITAYETAITAVAGGAQSYTYDDGQHRIVVSKAGLASARITLNELENRLADLDAKLCGTGGTRVIPGW